MDSKHTEAATLQKKKTINKGKMKKTIKNILCRPDPVFWPAVSEEQAKTLESAISIYKIEIPEFKKLHWKELKAIPKDQRPKQPKIKKVEGLIFGKTECTDAVKSEQCAAVIIDSTINPRTIVQPLIEACISSRVPVLCMNGLKKVSATNFGIPTCSLALKKGILQELILQIENIAKEFKTPPAINNNDRVEENMEFKNNDSDRSNQKNEQILADTMEVIEETKEESTITPIIFTYLYRTSKKTRVFNPSSEQPKAKKAFIGQDYIEFNNKTDDKKPDSKAFMKMIVKRVTNNQNRMKRK